VVVLNPVFHDGDLVGITGSLGHTDDVGGNRGGWSTDAEQVYEEGILIPPTKLYEGGKRNDAIDNIIRSNVRIPHQALGDLEALRSGNTVGEGAFARSSTTGARRRSTASPRKSSIEPSARSARNSPTFRTAPTRTRPNSPSTSTISPSKSP